MMVICPVRSRTHEQLSVLWPSLPGTQGIQEITVGGIHGASCACPQGTFAKD